MSKLAKLRAGHYLMPVPPVCHVSWTEQDWVNFIDNRGQWLPEN